HAAHPDGPALDDTGRCPVCDTVPPPGELEVRPGPGAEVPARDDPVARALAHPHRMLTPVPTTPQP
ncbi:MAG: hypothetical protein ACRDXB_01180, partial [Actinomycetes bacterium]